MRSVAGRVVRERNGRRYRENAFPPRAYVYTICLRIYIYIYSNGVQFVFPLHPSGPIRVIADRFCGRKEYSIPSETAARSTVPLMYITLLDRYRSKHHKRLLSINIDYFCSQGPPRRADSS